MPRHSLQLKPIRWMASTKEDLSRSPDAVKDAIGYALYEVQCGEKPANAKPLKGFGGAGVLEIVEDFDGDTWRAAYTLEIAEASARRSTSSSGSRSAGGTLWHLKGRSTNGQSATNKGH